jgi:hypothetical protein
VIGQLKMKKPLVSAGGSPHFDLSSRLDDILADEELAEAAIRDFPVKDFYEM